MPLQTKIVLSDKELMLIKDEQWILTKRVIIEKVYEILSRCIISIDEIIVQPGEFIFPTERPKIAKGENYLGLPYVTLDYPRYFDKEDILAIRTMFWWARFFSITFHVSGKLKKFFSEKILNDPDRVPGDFFLCIHPDQWQHHFEPDNYIPISSIPDGHLQLLIDEKDFLKFALKFDLDQIDRIEELLKEGYERIAKLVLQLPSR